MFSNKDPLYKLYTQLRNLIKGEDAQQTTQYIIGQPKYQIRFFLALIAYYNYFIFGHAATFIFKVITTQQVQVHLSITPEENCAYQFLCNGPTDNGMLPLFFTKEFLLNEKEDHSYAHIFVNLLACTLGCDPNKSHFYPLIFHLKSYCGNPKKMIGSTLKKEFYDCGYKLPDGYNLENDASIMKNHRRHRCLLNSLVWIPIVWNAILFKNEFVQTCKGIYHFMNFVKDERRNNRTDYQIYFEYANSRALSFLQLFDEDTNGLQMNQDPKVFAVYVFYQYVQDQWGNPPPALVNYFNDIASTQRYEEYLQRIFIHIETNYAQLGKIYQPKVAEDEPIAIILRIKDQQVNYLQNPGYTPDQYASFIATAAPADDDDENEKPEFPVTESFIRDANLLNLLRHTPFFVRCYKTFNVFLWKQISRGDFDKPFIQVIDHLPRAKEEDRRSLTNLFYTFIKRFNQVKVQLTDVQFGCQTFEFPLLDPGSLLCHFLDTDPSKSILLLFIRKLLEVQRKFLRSLEELERPLDLYFDVGLLANSNNPSMLSLSFDHAQLTLMSSTIPVKTWLEDLFALHRQVEYQNGNIIRKNISFDRPRIELECIQFAVGSLPYEEQPADELDPLVHINVEDMLNDFSQIEEIAHIQNQSAGALSESNLVLLEQLQSTGNPIERLSHLLENKTVVNRKGFNTTIPDRTKKRTTDPGAYSTERITENDVMHVCRLLGEFILILCRDNDIRNTCLQQHTHNLLDTIKSHISEDLCCPKVMNFIFTGVQIEHLFSFSDAVKDMYLSQAWKFQNLFTNCVKQFNNEQKQCMEKIRVQFKDTKYQKRLEIILGVLMEDKPGFIKAIENNMSQSLVSFLRDHTNIISAPYDREDEGEQQVTLRFLKDIIPPNVTVRQLKALLLELHALLGDIVIATQIANAGKAKQANKDHEELPNAYREQIPEKIDQSEYKSELPQAIPIPEEASDSDSEFVDDIPSHLLSFREETEFIIEDDEPLTNAIVGIRNEKKNCWLSAVLQCLTADKCTIFPGKNLSRLPIKDSFELSQSLSNVLLKLYEKRERSISVIEFYNKFISFYNTYAKKNNFHPLESNVPHPVDEFFYHMKHAFEIERKVGVPSIMSNLFGKLFFKKNIKYDCCGHDQTEEEDILSLIVEKKTSFHDLLTSYSAAKDAAKCKGEKCKRNARKHRTILLDNTRVKITLPIAICQRHEIAQPITDLPFTEDMDFSSFLSNQGTNTILGATARVFAAIHYTSYDSMQSVGHYYASVSRIRPQNDDISPAGEYEWFEVDDAKVSRIKNPNQLNPCNICMIFLEVSVTRPAPPVSSSPASQRTSIPPSSPGLARGVHSSPKATSRDSSPKATSRDGHSSTIIQPPSSPSASGAAQRYTSSPSSQELPSSPGYSPHGSYSSSGYHDTSQMQSPSSPAPASASASGYSPHGSYSSSGYHDIPQMQPPYSPAPAPASGYSPHGSYSPHGNYPPSVYQDTSQRQPPYSPGPSPGYTSSQRFHTSHIPYDASSTQPPSSPGYSPHGSYSSSGSQNTSQMQSPSSPAPAPASGYSPHGSYSSSGSQNASQTQPPSSPSPAPAPGYSANQRGYSQESSPSQPPVNIPTQGQYHQTYQRQGYPHVNSPGSGVRNQQQQMPHGYGGYLAQHTQRYPQQQQPYPPGMYSPGPQDLSASTPEYPPRQGPQYSAQHPLTHSGLHGGSGYSSTYNTQSYGHPNAGNLSQSYVYAPQSQHNLTNSGIYNQPPTNYNNGAPYNAPQRTNSGNFYAPPSGYTQTQPQAHHPPQCPRCGNVNCTCYRGNPQ